MNYTKKIKMSLPCYTSLEKNYSVLCLILGHIFRVCFFSTQNHVQYNLEKKTLSPLLFHKQQNSSALLNRFVVV